METEKENYSSEAAERTLAFPVATYRTRELAETMIYTVLAIAAPAILAHTPNNQWITGTIVNALLFIACFRVGIVNAIFIGLLPSAIALMRGLLPLPMVAMLPYIMIGNAAMVSAFGLIKIKSFLTRAMIASVLKFGVIFGAVSLLVTVPHQIAIMMGWPQLITALAGGLIAAGVGKVITTTQTK